MLFLLGLFVFLEVRSILHSGYCFRWISVQVIIGWSRENTLLLRYILLFLVDLKRVYAFARELLIKKPQNIELWLLGNGKLIK